MQHSIVASPEVVNMRLLFPLSPHEADLVEVLVVVLLPLRALLED